MITLKKLCYLLTVFTLTVTTVSCSNNDDQIIVEEQLTPSQLLSSTPWETTNVKNNVGQSIPLTDPTANGYVGFAYFKSNATFTIYGLNNVLRSRGTWSISADGKTRTITGLNPDGTTAFTRVVEILVLNKDEFTYRIIPNTTDPSIYYDVVHKKVAHEEPNLAQLLLASTAWETTGAKDKDGNAMSLTDANVASYVGFAYFRANGKYAIYGLNNVLRNQGDWSISADGKTRTIVAKDPTSGAIIFTRDVQILELNSDKFTYRITPNASDPTVFYDIIHTKVNHLEP